MYLCVFLVTLTSFWLLLQMLARWVAPWLGWLAMILYGDLEVVREEVLLGDRWGCWPFRGGQQLGCCKGCG